LRRATVIHVTESMDDLVRHTL